MRRFVHNLVHDVLQELLDRVITYEPDTNIHSQHFEMKGCTVKNAFLRLKKCQIGSKDSILEMSSSNSLLRVFVSSLYLMRDKKPNHSKTITLKKKNE